MRQLAAASGTSQALLHHHFGTKEQLYESVKAHAMARFIDHERDETEEELDGLGEGLRRYLGFCRDNPAMTRLAMWDELQGESRLWGGEPELFVMVRERVQDAQRLGKIRQDLDPDVLLLVISAVGRTWVQGRERFDRLRAQTVSEHPAEHFVDQIIDLLLNGCGPR